MLEQILIRMMDLQGYCMEKVELGEDGLHLWLRREKQAFVCPQCGDRAFATHSHWEAALRECPKSPNRLSPILHVEHPWITKPTEAKRPRGRIAARKASLQQKAKIAAIGSVGWAAAT
jgi:hypothetical protein